MQRGSIVLVFTLAEEGYSAGLEESVTLLMASDPGITVEQGHLTMPGVGVAILSVG